MDRKKELKAQYRQMRPDMGLFMIQSALDGKTYLEETGNLPGMMNSARFKLQASSHKNRALQVDWDRLGADNFVIAILEKLEYDEDAIKEDYTEELALLKLLWIDKLVQEGRALY